MKREQRPTPARVGRRAFYEETTRIHPTVDSMDPLNTMITNNNSQPSRCNCQAGHKTPPRDPRTARQP